MIDFFYYSFFGYTFLGYYFLGYYFLGYYFFGSYFFGYCFLTTGYYFLVGAGYVCFTTFLVLYLKLSYPCLVLSFLYFSGTKGIDIMPVSLKSYKLAFTSYIKSSLLTSSSATWNWIYFSYENLKLRFFVKATSLPERASVRLVHPPIAPTT